MPWNNKRLLILADSKGGFTFANWPSNWVKNMPLPGSASWVRVPISYEGVCDWAIVCENPMYREHIHSQMIIYKDLLSAECRQFTPITIHLQGFIKDLNIHVFGDWDQ